LTPLHIWAVRAFPAQGAQPDPNLRPRPPEAWQLSVYGGAPAGGVVEIELRPPAAIELRKGRNVPSAAFFLRGRMALPGTLEGLWKAGRTGGLSPLEQLRAVALRDAYEDLGQVPEAGGQPALLGSIAAKLSLIGGGHPSKEAVRQLLSKVDDDPAWYPGKRYQEKFGPAPALNGAKRRCIATSAMAAKKAGTEPTYNTVLADCPLAALRIVSPEAVPFLPHFSSSARAGGGGGGGGGGGPNRTTA